MRCDTEVINFSASAASCLLALPVNLLNIYIHTYIRSSIKAKHSRENYFENWPKNISANM
jgi:hypothetical protein